MADRRRRCPGAVDVGAPTGTGPDRRTARGSGRVGGESGRRLLSGSRGTGSDRRRGRAFVKACGPEVNPDTPGIMRSEIAIARHLPVEIPAPRLRAFAEDVDGWVVLVFDELDAVPVPTPWSEPDLHRALGTLDRVAVAGTPCPVQNMPSIAAHLASVVHGYAHLAADPPETLDPWERRHLDRLAELAVSSIEATAGDALVHFDVRSDNLMRDRSGAMWLVDWPHGCRGAPWVDAATLLLDVALYGGDPERHLTTSKALRVADPDARRDLARFSGASGCWRPRPARKAGQVPKRGSGGQVRREAPRVSAPRTAAARTAAVSSAVRVRSAARMRRENASERLPGPTWSPA